MKAVSSFVLAVSTSVISFLFKPDSGNVLGQADNVVEPNNSETGITLIYNDKNYQVSSFVVNDTSQLDLILNLPESISSTETSIRFQCPSLINGGFYSEDSQPIGWFQDRQKLHSQAQKNQLFNGYVYLDLENQPQIDYLTNQVPEALLGLQTGPVLIHQGNPVDLTLKQDKQARRSFAAISDEGSLIFGIITDSDNRITGPYLDQMPEILKTLSQTLELNLASAINLDGGSASTFRHQETHVVEIQPVGSYFCLRQ